MTDLNEKLALMKPMQLAEMEERILERIRKHTPAESVRLKVPFFQRDGGCFQLTAFVNTDIEIPFVAKCEGGRYCFRDTGELETFIGAAVRLIGEAQ